MRSVDLPLKWQKREQLLSQLSVCTKFKSIFYWKFNWCDWVCPDSRSALNQICIILCVCAVHCTYVFVSTWIFISNSTFFIAFASANQWIASLVGTVLYDFAHLIPHTPLTSLPLSTNWHLAWAVSFCKLNLQSWSDRVYGFLYGK